MILNKTVLNEIQPNETASPELTIKLGMNRGLLNENLLNALPSSSVSFTGVARGSAGLRVATTAAARGRHANGDLREHVTYGRGARIQRADFIADGVGTHTNGDAEPRLATGRGASTILINYTPTGKGVRVQRTAHIAAARGQHGAGISYVATGRGESAWQYASYVAAGRGYGAFELSHVASAEGKYRVADNDLIQYELYRGIDDEPDFSAAPFETFTSLPHETAVFTANQNYKLVLRKRNEYNLLSENVASWNLRIDASGDQDFNLPSAPDQVSISPALNGSARVQAAYAYRKDGDDQAETYLVYLTSNGVDPDPSSDTPTEVTMNKVDGVAHLDWTSAEYANGSTIKVLVRTRRDESGEDVDSDNTNIVSTTADTSGPDAPDGGVF